MPAVPQRIKTTECFRSNILTQLSDPLAAGDGRRTFDVCCPPRDDDRIILEQLENRNAGCFAHKEWYDSGTVPESHRPSRRSSRRASRTPDGFRVFGSFFVSSLRGGSDVASRTPPRRSNLARRPSGSSTALVRAETSLA